MATTFPVPDPAKSIVRLPVFGVGSPGGAAVNVPVTVTLLPLSVTIQVPVPLQPPPLQPAKLELFGGNPVGVAVRVTKVPLG